MVYSIENEFLRVEVRQEGAELASIKSKKTEREYIWQADPKIWGSSSPILFPNIGPLKNGEMIFEEKKYKLPKHGIVRNNKNIELINKTPTRLSFKLSSSEETLEVFPFKFDLKINFFLVENKLQIFHEVVNLNSSPMYFSLGGHPALNIMWDEDDVYEDYFLEFNQEENASILRLKENGLLEKDETPYLDQTKVLAFEKGMFDNDALIFSDLSSSLVTLRSKKSKDNIQFAFDDFPILGIWSKPEAPYVCLEPWNGLPDFDESDQQWVKKTGNIKLTEHTTHYASYAITINENYPK